MAKEGFEVATFETAQRAFMKSFELLERLYSEKKPFTGPEYTAQEAAPLYLPTLKACWNALVQMKMLAKGPERDDAERHHTIFWKFIDEKKIARKDFDPLRE